MANVLGHSGKALLSGHDRMRLVHCLENRLQHNLGDRIEISRHAGVQDRDTVLLGLMLDGLSDVSTPCDSAGVIHQQSGPVAMGILETSNERKEARTVLRSARLDRIFEALDDFQRTRRGEFIQFVSLSRNTDVGAILTASQVHGRVHSLLRRASYKNSTASSGAGRPFEGNSVIDGRCRVSRAASRRERVFDLGLKPEHCGWETLSIPSQAPEFIHRAIRTDGVMAV
ncbi:MAG: hypothetical protein M0038_16070 [Pseudomonadota bacterium]|nr:hypothetical protein [Pseudomonadota bacterium]